MRLSKKMRPVWDWPEMQSCVLSYEEGLTTFSPLAVTDSTFPLLNTQPLPAKQMLLNWRGLKILPEWLQLCLINASPSSFP